MKNQTFKIAKNLLNVSLAVLFAVSCSKNSAQNSTTNSGGAPNSGQSVGTVTGTSPALKVYGNSISDLTGLYGLGGQLLNVNLNVLTQGLDITLRLPATVIFLAQSYLLKYPQIQTSMTNDNTGAAVLHLKISIVDAIAAYKKWQQKNPGQVQNPPPVSELPPVPASPAEPAAPVVTVPSPVIIPAAGFQGTYVGAIATASNGVFGDGSWPQGDATILVERPDVRGYGYALGGDFNITVAADGKLGGQLTIWGVPCPIEAGQIPAGSDEVTFIVPGATGYLKFGANGSVTGYVYEPGPAGDDWESHKRGNLSGNKQ